MTDRPEVTGVSDELTTLLRGVRATTTLFGMADLPADWGLEFPASASGAYFHVVYGGVGWLHLAGEQPRRVEPGHVALLARGSAHKITGTSEGVARVRFDPVRWVPNVIDTRRDTGPAGMNLVCAAIEVGTARRPGVLEAMPEVLLVPAGASGAPPVSLLVESLRHEAGGGGVGGGHETVLARLGDALLAQLVRWWLAERDGDSTPVSPLTDPRIGPVLRAIDGDLAHPWTIPVMARIAALSRSSFAERFRKVVGLTPGQYVATLRLETAHELLTQGGSIRVVSHEVGYRSEQAFSRAFTRHHGRPPSHLGR